MSKLTTEYWFPLRPGLLVNVRLPDDVTHQDVDRLERFLRTLPFEEREEPTLEEGEAVEGEGDEPEEVEESGGEEAPSGEAEPADEEPQDDDSEAPPEDEALEVDDAADGEAQGDAVDAPIARLREPLRALCALAKEPPIGVGAGKRRGRPAVSMPLACEAVLCKVLLRAPARTVTRSVVPGLHYNSLIRLLHAPSTTAAVRDLYLIAQTALMRAKGEEGVAADFYMKETLSCEGRIATYAERIAQILREAEDMEVTLLFAPLPPREVGPTVPRGTTFEEALRKDPSLAQRVRRN